MSSQGTQDTDVHAGVQELYDTFWSHSWSDLPTEQEQAIEEAFELVQAVHDAQDGGP